MEWILDLIVEISKAIVLFLSALGVVILVHLIFDYLEKKWFNHN